VFLRQRTVLIGHRAITFGAGIAANIAKLPELLREK
jgi:hypothetical protein